MNLKKFSLFVLFSLVIAFVTEASTVEKSVNARYGFSQFDNYKNGYFKVWNNLKGSRARRRSIRRQSRSSR